MLDALYTAASGMLAQQIGLDVIANNLANVNTVGYKGQRAAFEDLLYNNIGSNQGASQGQQMGLGVAISGIQAQFDEGSAQNTGVPTDFMITGGAGFFVVRSRTARRHTRGPATSASTAPASWSRSRATWCSTRPAARSPSRRT